MGNEGSKNGSTAGKGSRKRRGSSTGLEHTGHIDCHCLHEANESVEEARTSGRIHLNSSCFWSCCGARWDDFNCTRNSPPDPHEHTGHIDCHCLHHANESVREAHNAGRIHLNDSCFWSCCGARWDDFNCTNPSGGRPESDEDTPGGDSHEHTGHIDCHCLHQTDETVEEARSSGKIHLNTSCFWSCCGARWDDFTCTRNSVRGRSGGGGGGANPHQHTGFIACKCGHKRKEVWAEARTHDLIHQNGACRWSCCGENWDEAECSGGRYDIDPSRLVHSGHINCRCGHHKNDTVDSLRSSHRVHLNIGCFWSCCGARWDDPICERTLPADLRRGNADDSADVDVPQPSRKKPKKHRKTTEDFNENISMTIDIGNDSAEIDIDY